MNLGEQPTFVCGICGGDQASGDYEAREMMFGLRIPFRYSECSKCGSLWLMNPPEDFQVHYPKKYYSFSIEGNGPREWLEKRLRAKRDSAYLGDGGVLGRFLARHYEEPALLSVSKISPRREARILDVGCGSGKLLQRMAALSYKNLAGVDPFLPNEVNYPNGLRIRNCRLEDLAGERFDVVMFHHSLEHIGDPLGTLRAATRLLLPDGMCLVRLPVVAHAWKEYRTNWVQLDPPRHMWVPTEKAMRMLTESAGLSMERIEYQSTEFQFLGSELCARDVPFGGLSIRDLRSYFPRAQVKEFRRAASRLNREGRGDEALFLLKVEG